MTLPRRLVVLLLLAVFATGSLAAGEPKSLYKRLGGYDAIAAVTDDFLGRMIADKQLGRYFVGLSKNSRDILRQHLVDFICEGTGGPCIYIGRDLGVVHTNLKITQSDWKLAVKHLQDTLAKFKVPKGEQEDLLDLISDFEEDIVDR